MFSCQFLIFLRFHGQDHSSFVSTSCMCLMMFMYVLLLYAKLHHVGCLGVGWGGLGWVGVGWVGGWDVNVPVDVLSCHLPLSIVAATACMLSW